MTQKPILVSLWAIPLLFGSYMAALQGTSSDVVGMQLWWGMLSGLQFLASFGVILAAIVIWVDP